MYIAQKIGTFNESEALKAIDELKEISCMLQGLIDSL
jgi:hypothetical protein